MIKKKEKDWFKVKRYPHIGLPLNPNDRFKWIEKYVTTPSSIAKHSFLPFIHRTAQVKKFRKEYEPKTGKLNEKFLNNGKIQRKPSVKKRELFYASHLDSLIFNYYSKILSDKYEEILKSSEYNLYDVVNAYRSIPINPLNKESSNKCNIDFANDVFKNIIDYKEKEFSVIAFDISSFFDNLNHKMLLEIWMEVLHLDKLPPDHFNVYKNITRFSHVDIVDIFEEFKDRIYTRKKSVKGETLEIKKKAVDKIKYLRKQNAIAFCKKDEFLKLKAKLLQPSKTKKMDDGNIVKRDFGIPQGSPISSVLANLYLLYFDKTINDFILKHGGLYRRYSDDMIVICPLSVKENLSELVYSEIEKYKLKIQPAKTQIFQFERNGNDLRCGQVFEKSINWNKNLIYLGFEFNGKNVFLKSASISGFYRKMKRTVRRAKHFSKSPYSKYSGEIFKKRIFKKFSYKGAKRTRKYIWDAEENMFIKTDSYNWGNFLSYAYKASNIMVSNKIKQQTKKHWIILNNLIKK
jgi:hypothetical protein